MPYKSKSKRLVLAAALTGVAILGGANWDKFIQNKKATVQENSQYGNLSVAEFKKRFDDFPTELPSVQVRKVYAPGSKRGIIVLWNIHADSHHSHTPEYERDLALILTESQEDHGQALEFLQSRGYTSRLGVEGVIQPSFQVPFTTLTHAVAEKMARSDLPNRQIYLDNIAAMEKNVIANRATLEALAISQNIETLASFTESQGWDKTLSAVVKKLKMPIFAIENMIYHEAAAYAVARKEEGTPELREQWRKIFKLYDELREQHLFTIPGDGTPFNTFLEGLGHELSGPETQTNPVDNQALYVSVGEAPVSIIYLSPKTLEKRADVLDRVYRGLHTTKTESKLTGR